MTLPLQISTLIEQLRRDTASLPLYRDGPEVDYTNATKAYALSLGLMVLGETEQPTANTLYFLGTRGCGDGVQNSESNMSGYVGRIDAENPYLYTALAEMSEELGLSSVVIKDIRLRYGARVIISPKGKGTDQLYMDIRPGKDFTEQRYSSDGKPSAGRTIHVQTMLATCPYKPPVKIDGRELIDYEWVPLGEIRRRPNLSPGFADYTLPSTLAALGLSDMAIRGLVGHRTPK